ncbi:MAG: glycosyltransferase family 4 protein [Puniceicoccales bacterium]
MRIAVFHNYYKLPGGEDVVFELECKSLEERGHTVLPFVVRNSEVFRDAGALKKLHFAWKSADNRDIYRKVTRFLIEQKPDIGHVHNWFPVLSPSVYHAHRNQGIPVVQTLHNYRISCANGTFRRQGQDCHDCRPGRTLPAVRHKCYRDSRIGSLSWMRTVNKAWKNGTYLHKVDQYICPSQVVADQHLQLGLPAEKLTVVHNGSQELPRPSRSVADDFRSDALFIGRLTPEKGADIAIEAWKLLTQNLPNESTPILRIVGQGPDEQRLRSLAATTPNVHFCGQQPRERVAELLHQTKVLIFPSRWPEPFGLGMVEAFAAGCPVIASDCGAPAEIISNGVHGYLFPPGDAAALRDQIALLLHDPSLRDQMGVAARRHYVDHFTPEAHSRALLRCFEKVIATTNPAKERVL